MSNEEFLVNLIGSAAQEMESQLEAAKLLPEGLTPPGFNDGKIAGLSRALELVSVALYLYQRKTDEEKPK